MLAVAYQPDDVIGDRYRIVQSLGSGGTGTTYEAEDLQTHRRVALKTVLLQQVRDWKILESLEREAAVLQKLDHPQIPDYLDYFYEDAEGDRRFYLVQELVEGRSLAELVRRGRRSRERDVIDIARQILRILEYLHGLEPPVIHCDIKPQNILRQPDGTLYLVDFGAVQETYRTTIARGTFVGTLGYMPPEQFGGKAQPASDLYALGATLLFGLTGRSPADLPQKYMKIDFEGRISVSEDFAYWLRKILEPAIEDRFQSATTALLFLKTQQAIAQQSATLFPTASKARGISIVPSDRDAETNIVRLVGSRMWIERNDRQFLLVMPQKQKTISQIQTYAQKPPSRIQTYQTIAFIVVLATLLLRVCLFAWHLAFRLSTTETSILMSFLFTLLIMSVAIQLGLERSLSIDAENFAYKTRFFGLQREVCGKTRNISSLTLS